MVRGGRGGEGGGESCTVLSISFFYLVEELVEKTILKGMSGGCALNNEILGCKCNPPGRRFPTFRGQFSRGHVKSHVVMSTQSTPVVRSFSCPDEGRFFPLLEGSDDLGD